MSRHAKLSQFRTDDNGQVFILFALIAPVIVLFVTFGVELARVHAAKTKLVNVADAAALSAALLSDRPVGKEVLEKRAGQTVFAHFDRSDTSFALEMIGDKPPYEVKVTIARDVPPLFPQSVFPMDMSIAHSGSAMVARTGPLCALALASGGDAGILLQGRAKVDAPQCGVMINNEQPDGALHIFKDGQMTAEYIHAVGGFTGTSFFPLPETGKPAVVDPFLDKTDWPVPGACEHRDVRLNTGTHTLSPGVYCGLRITGNAEVEFLPGIYFIRDSHFLAGSSATLKGHGVSFFLTEDHSHFRIKDAVKLDLKPMTTGPLANLLVARRPDDIPRERRPEFAGRGPSRVEGVIYLPNTHLRVAPHLDAAFTPERLVFVADRLTFHNREPLTLVANGEIGYVSTAARITR